MVEAGAADAYDAVSGNFKGAAMYGFAIDSLVNQFAARFRPGGADCLYFHNDGASGLPCSTDEAQALTRAYAQTARRWARWMTAWVLLSAVVLGVFAAIRNFEPSRWEAAALFLAPFPFAILALKRASDAPLHAFRMRGAVAPPVDASTLRRSRLAALPNGAVVSMVAVNLLLAFQTLKDGMQAHDYVFIAVMAASAALIWAVVSAKAGPR